MEKKTSYHNLFTNLSLITQEYYAFMLWFLPFGDHIKFSVTCPNSIVLKTKQNKNTSIKNFLPKQTFLS